MKNLKYLTEEIGKFYSGHRVTWDEFYPSERWIFEKVAGPELNMGLVLDVGCAVGGLANALEEKFTLSKYVGVDINKQAIEKARMINKKCGLMRRFESADILEMKCLEPAEFDSVFSLGCADWNVRTEDIISSCWKSVRKGGHFILTLRLTPKDTIREMIKSYQYIYFGEELPDEKNSLEKAPYVVFNVREALGILSTLSPSPKKIIAYGYWGKPSHTAVTPFNRVVFSAFAIEKAKVKCSGTALECHWPLEIIL